MYNQFFGFKENPFKHIPDPAHHFLSKSHEEALAHLFYAVAEGEGFIALIGDKGVGKTALCQTFIDRKDEKTEVAYVCEPELNPKGLLKKISAQLNVKVVADNVKAFTDALNVFLMQKKLEGKKVVLFLDDAQNLNRDVLEQVRLLSNLETTRDKLLQIVLVGDLKLVQMLNSYDLRQIGQRVSVSWRVTPLTYHETEDYITDRLNIYSRSLWIEFDRRALKRIYKYSGGNFRKINTVCARALLTAYMHGQKYVSGDIVKAAVSELTGKSSLHIRRALGDKRLVLIAALGSLIPVCLIAAYISKLSGDEKIFAEAEFQPIAVQSQLAAGLASPFAELQRDSGSDEEGQPRPNGPRQSTQIDMPPASQEPSENLPETAITMTHSIQVGAFLSEGHAQKLTADLMVKGYRASIVTVKDSRGKTWYTVRIGDYPSRKIARQHAAAFSAAENMQTAVRPYGKL